MSTTAVRRPFGVSLLSIVLIVVGVLDIVSGIVLMVTRGEDDILAAADATSGEITAAGTLAIVFGVIAILLASLLRSGSNFARYLIGIVAVLRLVSLVWVVVAYHEIHWYSAIWPAILYLLVAGYLFFDDDAKEFFARS